MHLVIISGAARLRARSNTAKIIAAFQKGYEEGGNTTEVWYLSDQSQWAGATQAFERSDNILIALPLYVENIPGILLEFLSGLRPKTVPGTRLAFLLQGGFPEASQSRCCEAYLETLPALLGCEYAGTLIKGDLFGLSLTGGQGGVSLSFAAQTKNRQVSVRNLSIFLCVQYACLARKLAASACTLIFFSTRF